MEYEAIESLVSLLSFLHTNIKEGSTIKIGSTGLLNQKDAIENVLSLEKRVQIL